MESGEFELQEGANVNFRDSIRYGFKKSLDFKGSATRFEYWSFVALSASVWILAAVADSALAPLFGALKDPFFSPVELAATLVLILPLTSVSARRLHDSGKTAKILVSWLIPITLIAVAASRFAQLPNLGVPGAMVAPTDLLLLILVGAFSSLLLLLIFTVLMLLPTKSYAKGNRYIDAELPMPNIDEGPAQPKTGVVNIGL
jgi:uncharacterized membrane protein YhaH (DUF805 family)